MLKLFSFSTDKGSTQKKKSLFRRGANSLLLK